MNMTVQSGDIVTLNCSITGSEPITYTWYKDGVRLEARRSSMLVFHPISSFDSGVYRCTAVNAVNGLASREFTVSGNCNSINMELNYTSHLLTARMNTSVPAMYSTDCMYIYVHDSL